MSHYILALHSPTSLKKKDWMAQDLDDEQATSKQLDAQSKNGNLNHGQCVLAKISETLSKCTVYISARQPAHRLLKFAPEIPRILNQHPEHNGAYFDTAQLPTIPPPQGVGLVQGKSEIQFICKHLDKPSPAQRKSDNKSGQGSRPM